MIIEIIFFVDAVIASLMGFHTTFADLDKFVENMATKNQEVEVVKNIKMPKLSNWIIIIIIIVQTALLYDQSLGDGKTNFSKGSVALNGNVLNAIYQAVYSGALAVQLEVWILSIYCWLMLCYFYY